MSDQMFWHDQHQYHCRRIALMLDFQTIHCPYCGEPLEIALDTSAGDQDYIEDCQVCCRPISIALSVDPDGEACVSVRAENEI